MRLALSCFVLAAAACGGPGPDNPVGPTPPPPPAAILSPTPPFSPPFTVTLDGATSAHPGRWPVLVTIATPQGVIPRETPDVLRVTCAGQTMQRSAGLGSIQMACDFGTVGDYRVSATVTGTQGFSASAAQTVRVSRPPAFVVAVYYSVILSDSDGRVDVAFSTQTITEAYRYLWDFDDGTTDRTILSGVRHTYCCRSEERVVRVRVVDADGNDLATGSVAGRW